MFTKAVLIIPLHECSYNHSHDEPQHFADCCVCDNQSKMVKF